MSEIGEGIGGLVEGALVARAVDGADAAPGKDGHTHESACLNCGTALQGPHCHQCGQRAHIHRTIGAIFHDLLHGVLHFEGRTWNTLPMLAWKPGELMRRYIDGERAKFVSPMAMFLFSVFIMFAVFQIMGISAPTEIANGDVDADLTQAVAKLESDKAQLERDLAQTDAGDPARAVIERQIRETDESLDALAKVNDMDVNISLGTGGVTGWKRLDEGIHKWRSNPGLMLYKLQTNAYKFSWLLIPLSVPFVWLVFAWRRRFGLYDHAVFVTYSIAFMSLMGIVLTIAGSLGVSGQVLFAIFAIVALAHLYRQIKGGYELSRFSAAWRTLALILLIQVVFALFLALLVLLGLVG